MPEIRSIPCRIDADGAARLAAELAQAFAAGVNLGPRGSQIRGLATSLDHLTHELRREIAVLAAAGAEDLDRSCLRERLEDVAHEVSRLVAAARTFPT